jgi:hypothetical protein
VALESSNIGLNFTKRALFIAKKIEIEGGFFSAWVHGQRKSLFNQKI